MYRTCVVVGLVGTAGSIGMQDRLAAIITYTGIALIGLGGIAALRRFQARVVAAGTLIAPILILTATAPFFGGLNGTSFAGWPAIILLAALTLGYRTALITALIGAGVTLGLFGLEEIGWEPLTANRAFDGIVTRLGALFAIAYMAGTTLQRMQAAIQTAREHESTALAALAERDQELTLRREVEQSLQAAVTNANRANTTKSQFLANMSHELRTPLNAIIGYAEILLEELEDDPDATDDLARIRGAGKHLLTLINDVLDLSKIEAGGMELALGMVDLDALLDEVVETIRPLVAVNANELEVHIGPDLGDVYTDSTRVRQVLLNLISNAAKFTSEGRVSLSAERAEMGGREVIVFSIHDSGIGITPAQLNRLFRPFAQADSSTSRKFGGTGLGLVLSQRFAEMLEGEILVDSTPGEGSTFSFLLPTRTAASELAVLSLERLEEAKTTNKPIVLCVDDSPDDLRMLDRILVGEGLHPILCSDPRRALVLAKRVQPAAITLDLHMPHRDGHALLADLKGDPMLRDIRVVVVSVDRQAAATVAAGASGWLPKPVDRERLVQLVEALDEGEGPILVVDDDEDTRDVLRRTLEHRGFEVEEATNGQEAMDLLGSIRPRLMLLDLMMPIVDGFEVAEWLRSSPDWVDLPVLVLTSATLGDAERARLAGCSKVLEKGPATLRNLVREIRTAAA